MSEQRFFFMKLLIGQQHYLMILYTVKSKGSRTEFFTAFLPTPSTGPRLNYVVETVSHNNAN